MKVRVNEYIRREHVKEVVLHLTPAEAGKLKRVLAAANVDDPHLAFVNNICLSLATSLKEIN